MTRLQARLLGPTPVGAAEGRGAVRHTVLSAKRSTAIAPVSAVVTTALLWGGAHRGWLLAWLVAVAVLHTQGSWAMGRGLTRLTTDPDGPRWDLRHRAWCLGSTAACGLAWGALAWVPVVVDGRRGDQLHAVVACMVLLHVAAGVVFGAGWHRAFACWHVGVCVLGAAGLVHAGSTGLAVVVAYTTFAALPLRAELSRSVLESVRLGVRNEDLVQQLHEQATTDGLTGLANRVLFGSRLQAAIQDRQARPAAADPDGRAMPLLAVLYLDLDGFKVVNDTHGHVVGDDLLRCVAGRLAGALERAAEAGCQPGVVARMGGDEFTVVVHAPPGGQEALRRTADAVRAALGRPYAVGDRTLHVTASVGVALWRPGTGADDLVALADAALYAAKAGGKDQVRLQDVETPTGRSAGASPVGALPGRRASDG